jgi:hypothetical protein
MQLTTTVQARAEPTRRDPDRGAAAADEYAAFDALRCAYLAFGGLARGDDVARLLEDRARGDFVSLARLIASRRIFGLEWQDTFWIPMFQFDLGDLSVRRCMKPVLDELASAFDGWRLAAWFVEPNDWLKECRPIDLIVIDPDEVAQAARADRFVAAG